MATETGQDPGIGSPRAASFSLTTLRKRADFLKAARAKRSGQAGLLLQARERDDDDLAIRVGYTCSKKIGNAVTRNRAKRRLRAIARDILASQGVAGWDYVLVGRPDATTTRPFDDLRGDLIHALKKIHS